MLYCTIFWLGKYIQGLSIVVKVCTVLAKLKYIQGYFIVVKVCTVEYVEGYE